MHIYQIRTMGAVAAAAFAAMAVFSTPALAADAPLPLRVILVGDSTMATRSGYGDALCARFSPDVSCINLARGGRSTSSYRAEGLWDKVQALLRDGAGYRASYVLIQFGHNDQPGKGKRTTDVTTSYPANLARYAQEVKALGAVPVLVSPLTRRTFKGPNLTNDLAPWSGATLAVAKAEHVPAIDLNRISYWAVQAMGQDEADTLAMEPPPPKVDATPATAAASTASVEPQGTPKSSFDRTHVGAKGASLFAGMVATELAKVAPVLAPALKASK
jgi:lysophospholipase L1-like esterase